MNKQELIDAVAQAAGLKKTEAADAVEAVVSTITEQMQKGDEVKLIGFGTFLVARRGERTGRNPQTGKAMTIPATNVPKFKAGKKLKEAIN